MKKVIIVMFLVLTVIVFGCSKSDPVKDEFAKCLSDKGVKFFGSYQCSHCTNQKALFGSSMKYVAYIECGPLGGPQNQVCVDAKIVSYPTWEFADGSRLVGERSLNELGEKAGCPL
ncbi:MAG: hypothetical protein AABX19_01645 [Nanoarchaeota archaeon]